MKQIILSSGQVTNIANGIRSTATNVTYGNYVLTNNASLAWLRIMKGTVPADFSTLNTQTARSADVLVSIPIQQMSSVTVVGDAFRIDTGGTYVNATASGTATWFWIASGGSNNATLSQSTWSAMSQLIGTVTAIGGGGDIELGTVSIVSGAPFKVSTFDITIDHVSTY